MLSLGRRLQTNHIRKTGMHHALWSSPAATHKNRGNLPGSSFEHSASESTSLSSWPPPQPTAGRLSKPNSTKRVRCVCFCWSVSVAVVFRLVLERRPRKSSSKQDVAGNGCVTSHGGSSTRSTCCSSYVEFISLFDFPSLYLVLRNHDVHLVRKRPAHAAVNPRPCTTKGPVFGGGFLFSPPASSGCSRDLQLEKQATTKHMSLPFPGVARRTCTLQSRAMRVA